MIRILIVAMIVGANCSGLPAQNAGPESSKNVVGGPRMTDAQFFDALDLGQPALADVKAAVDAGNLDMAKHLFVKHLKSRATPKWHFDWRDKPPSDKRPSHPNVETADRFARNELVSTEYWHDFGDDIKWTTNYHPDKYVEWTWQLNRHSFWQTLGQAYWNTGDEKYARAFVAQMLDWVNDNPVPLDQAANGRDSAWRTLEAGLRTERIWIDAFYYFLSSNSFSDNAIVTMVKSFAEHARYLMKFHTGGNWLATEADGLYHTGVIFPEFKESSAWRTRALDTLYRELDHQVYPDGAQVELTTGYHQITIQKFVGALRIAQINAYDFPKDYLEKLEKMYDYDLHALMPDGTLPPLNDAGRSDVRRILKEGFALYPNRKDFQWTATEGREGERPKETSHAFPYAGQFVMRSGWETDARYLMFEAGPYGLSHQHEDKLSFVIHAYGAYLLAEGGIYAYDRSVWRRYVLSSYAHNVIHVDNMDQCRRGADHRNYVVKEPQAHVWKTTPTHDYAEGSFGRLPEEGFGERRDKTVVHTRGILYVKETKPGAGDDYWIVVDTLDPKDDKSHLYESMFHLDVPDVEVDPSTKRILTKNPDAANLAVIPATAGIDVTIVKAKKDWPVQGWIPDGLYKIRPLPTAIYRLKATGTTRFVYLFYPLAKGASLPVTSVELISQTVGTTAVRVTFNDGRIDQLEIGQEIRVNRGRR